jgi:hypothetical protein
MNIFHLLGMHVMSAYMCNITYAHTGTARKHTNNLRGPGHANIRTYMYAHTCIPVNIGCINYVCIHIHTHILNCSMNDLCTNNVYKQCNHSKAMHIIIFAVPHMLECSKYTCTNVSARNNITITSRRGVYTSRHTSHVTYADEFLDCAAGSLLVVLVERAREHSHHVRLHTQHHAYVNPCHMRMNICHTHMGMCHADKRMSYNIHQNVSYTHVHMWYTHQSLSYTHRNMRHACFDLIAGTCTCEPAPCMHTINGARLDFMYVPNLISRQMNYA